MEQVMHQTAAAMSPARILEVGMGFFATKTLLSAIKLELFTFLGEGSASPAAIQAEFGLHNRGLYDYLDALVALGFLNREGYKENARYANTEATRIFLDKNKPASYVGGILEMANDRLYPFWGSLEEGLRTGKPQNEVKQTGKPIFEAIYADPQRLELFLDGMAGIQIGNFKALAASFPFEQYRSMCDIGGANALLSVIVAQEHPHLAITSVDLPPVEPVADKNIRKYGLQNRISLASLDMTRQPFPEADIITMGNILHDWNLEEKKLLIAKAYSALPDEGALIVIENIIDDERLENAFGLLMSLNMLIETEGGYDYTFADFTEWATEAGFRYTTKLPLGGPASAAIAYK
jgi:hypothetical protein